MPNLYRAIDRVARPNVTEVAAATAMLLVTDQAYLRVHDGALGAGLDEAAHLLTGLLALWVLTRAPHRLFAIGLLIMSVLIDLDHVPGLLGFQWLTRGTQRPYTHSLAALAIVGLAAIAWRSRRPLLTGGFVGLAVHFGRDLAESHAGVPLLWPWTTHSDTVPHWSYLAAMGMVASVASWQVRSRAIRRSRDALVALPRPQNSGSS